MHVVRHDGELRRQGAARGGQPALGADRGLGGAGRTGGEVEQETVGGAGPGRIRAGARVGREESLVLLRVGHQDTDSGEVEPGEQREVDPLGDQQSALGVQDVPGQLGAPAGGIDPGDRRTGERGGGQPQRELRGVVQQHPEMRCGARGQQLGEERGPGGGAGRDLVMAEHRVLAPQSRPVVVPAVRYECGDGLHGGAR
ncbi:hypothetical protein AQJ64_19500 [Streptomyces griseoruber]|uniref:Uncharacterized protein n=1 Tax=Streptomyces griseoruber TaxID=1943 RepID=A0A101SY31_9ACTN|nr:hypothetical protein AQJ64_19500 [Streptomyces griseoruber]